MKTKWILLVITALVLAGLILVLVLSRKNSKVPVHNVSQKSLGSKGELVFDPVVNEWFDPLIERDRVVMK